MIVTLSFLGLLAALVFGLTVVHKPHKLPQAYRTIRGQFLVFSLRMPLALLSASFIGILLPPNAVTPYIGPESGFLGILAAVVFGAVIPGGPILTFPLALVIWRTGAGEAQMIALLGSWSIFAMHRIVSFELPMLGTRFVMLRLASSGLLPIFAGLLAMTILSLWPR